MIIYHLLALTVGHLAHLVICGAGNDVQSVELQTYALKIDCDAADRQ